MMLIEFSENQGDFGWFSPLATSYRLSHSPNYYTVFNISILYDATRGEIQPNSSLPNFLRISLTSMSFLILCGYICKVYLNFQRSSLLHFKSPRMLSRLKIYVKVFRFIIQATDCHIYENNLLTSKNSSLYYFCFHKLQSRNPYHFIIFITFSQNSKKLKFTKL